MTQDDVDRTIARFRQAIEVMTANLYELENDPNRKVLEQAALTGLTAERWRDASRSLAQLWQWFTQFQAVVEQASTLRTTKAKVNQDQLARLDQLLLGPSIELSAEQVPLSRRALLGPSETTVRCRPDDLLTQMSQAFDQVKAVVAATGEAWRVLLPHFEQEETALASAEKMAASCGEVHIPELTAARAKLDDLSTRLANDPLSIDLNALAPLDGTIAIIQRDLEELGKFRTDLASRLDQARALLAELYQTMATARAAHDEVMIKIAGPAVPGPLAPDPTLAGRLEQVSAIASGGQWRAAREQLARWTDAVNDRLSRARAILAANQAPMAERDELRGRLDAYRAKANRLGLAEDAEVMASYELAHEALFTAPTDLATAVRLVSNYQRAIGSSGVPPREVPS